MKTTRTTLLNLGATLSMLFAAGYAQAADQGAVQSGCCKQEQCSHMNSGEMNCSNQTSASAEVRKDNLPMRGPGLD